MLITASGLGLLLGFSTLEILESAHVSIKDHPLSSLNGESASLWWVSLHTTLTDREVESLGGTFLVEELVTEGLFLGGFILFVLILAEFLNDGRVHLIKEGLVALLFVFEIVVLVTSFLRLGNKDVTIALVVPNDLVNSVLNFKETVLVGELGNVVGGLWVVRAELFVVGCIFLLLSEVFLVGLLVGLHV